MSQPFDPVFSDWYTKKRIGDGTDGRVYKISRTNADGETETGILKTIRIGANRNEDKGFNSINQKEGLIPSEENYNKIIKSITDNITTIQNKDNGKRFVKYNQWEIRDTSDGKGKLIMIRLEEMRSLSDVLSQFSFTLEETVNLGISICKSLKRCRDFGYVYPNLKPENVLFDRKGVCKLGDFGSFSILKPSKTSIAFKRTQYYSAPELVSTGKINATSDTYALGLILYTLVNRGRLPFAEMYPQEVTINGLNRSVENRINALPLPKPKNVNESLFKIISKACAFKPQERYLTPGQMLSDLKNVLDKKPFEKVQYEDIFSTSNAEPKSKSQLPIVEEIQNENETDKSDIKIQSKPENIPAKKIPEKNYSASLKDEITIPNVQPSDYFKGKKPTIKRKPALPVATYTPKKQEDKSHYTSEMRKIIALLIAIIIVAVMLFISILLRQTNSSDDILTNSSSNQIAEVNTNGHTYD